MSRPLQTIAADIEQHWPKVNYAAAPYLNALFALNSINDKYGLEDADGIIRRFLFNASTWRGEDAKRIKQELKDMAGL